MSNFIDPRDFNYRAAKNAQPKKKRSRWNNPRRVTPFNRKRV